MIHKQYCWSRTFTTMDHLAGLFLEKTFDRLRAGDWAEISSIQSFSCAHCQHGGQLLPVIRIQFRKHDVVGVFVVVDRLFPCTVQNLR